MIITSAPLARFVRRLNRVGDLVWCRNCLSDEAEDFSRPMAEKEGVGPLRLPYFGAPRELCGVSTVMCA